MCGCLSDAPYWGPDATQACALTGNLTSDPLVCRPVLNPPSHTSQGYNALFLRVPMHLSILITLQHGGNAMQVFFSTKGRTGSIQYFDGISGGLEVTNHSSSSY